jgi:hypothetical protein
MGHGGIWALTVDRVVAALEHLSRDGSDEASQNVSFYGREGIAGPVLYSPGSWYEDAALVEPVARCHRQFIGVRGFRGLQVERQFQFGLYFRVEVFEAKVGFRP